MVDALRLCAHAGAARLGGNGAPGVVEVALRLVEPRLVVQFDGRADKGRSMPSTAPAPSCLVARKCARVARCTVGSPTMASNMSCCKASLATCWKWRPEVSSIPSLPVVDRAVICDDLAADELPVISLAVRAVPEARRVAHELLDERD